MTERVQRKLVAVLAADIAGYSRLMGADEEGTLARLKTLRRVVIDPILGGHSGRLVKTTGDGLLVEFASVVDAVQCAIALQKTLSSHEGGRPELERFRLRVGINLGDVIIDEDDIHGDGVNVAARLEALAEPGGICISRSVRDHVRDRIGLPLDDLGEVQVKNIARPVRAFRIRLDGGVPAAAPGGAGRNRLHPALRLGLAGVVALPLLGGLVWLAVPQFADRPITAAGSALSQKRLSVLVLPFSNLSDDPQQGWFADGITEDLITDLSRISGAFVIARNTAFTFKDRAVDVREAARELGVRYVLEGSVRRVGEKVRLNVQLIDAQSAAHVWAERFDRDLKDIFALQTEVTGRIARTLNLELLEAETRRGSARAAGNLDAHDLALRAWVTLLNKPQTAATNREGEALARQAIALDPDSALAWTALTYVHTRAGSFGWTASREASLREAVAAGERAIALDPKSSDAIYMLGYALRTSGQHERSMQAMEQAIALNPNNPLPYHGLAYSRILLGRAEEALPLLEHAFRLSPREPLAAIWHWTAGYAQFLAGQDEAAIASARKAMAVNPEHPNSWWLHAAAAGQLGRIAEASAAVERYQTMPGAVRSAAALRERMRLGSDSEVYLRQLDRLVAGLRLAGMAE
ncbi:MAG: tetratricopeptide repeat protein [Alphaproteobacteria bacterium]|nr:tetratricopeptide repeat protein [Alphaproteobacteria bacterium]